MKLICLLVCLVVRDSQSMFSVYKQGKSACIERWKGNRADPVFNNSYWRRHQNDKTRNVWCFGKSEMVRPRVTVGNSRAFGWSYAAHRDAWNKRKGLSQQDAERMYVEALIRVSLNSPFCRNGSVWGERAIHRYYEVIRIEPKLSNSCENSKTSHSNREEPKSQPDLLQHPLELKLDLLPVPPPLPPPRLLTMIDPLTLLQDQDRIWLLKQIEDPNIHDNIEIEYGHLLPTSSLPLYLAMDPLELNGTAWEEKVDDQKPFQLTMKRTAKITQQTKMVRLDHTLPYLLLLPLQSPSVPLLPVNPLMPNLNPVDSYRTLMPLLHLLPRTDITLLHRSVPSRAILPLLRSTRWLLLIQHTNKLRSPIHQDSSLPLQSPWPLRISSNVLRSPPLLSPPLQFNSLNPPYSPL